MLSNSSVLMLAMAFSAWGQSPSGATSTIYTFTQSASPSGLTSGPNGSLYGTTAGAASSGEFGTVFQLEPPAVAGDPWTEITLHTFSGQPDGSRPEGGVVVGSAGELYGTTYSGGNLGAGCVYELEPGAAGMWTESILYSFGSIVGDSASPSAGLIPGASGTLYGTTSAGGDTGDGTVFALDPPAEAGGAWTEKILHDFSGLDGSTPLASVSLGESGVLYGTTYKGGAQSKGTVFQLTPPNSANGMWAETVIYSFVGGAFGENPAGGVALASGVLYGTALFGGSGNSYGTVFQLTPPASPHGGWTQSVIHSFMCCGTDGANPRGNLLVGNGTTLFGVTSGGDGDSSCYSLDSPGCGVVFELEPPTSQGKAWGETVLHRFTGADGSFPLSGLVSNGTAVLFGTTSQGGSPDGSGTVFEIAP